MSGSDMKWHESLAVALILVAAIAAFCFVLWLMFGQHA